MYLVFTPAKGAGREGRKEFTMNRIIIDVLTAEDTTLPSPDFTAVIDATIYYGDGTASHGQVLVECKEWDRVDVDAAIDAAAEAPAHTVAPDDELAPEEAWTDESEFAAEAQAEDAAEAQTEREAADMVAFARQQDEALARHLEGGEGWEDAYDAREAQAAEAWTRE